MKTFSRQLWQSTRVREVVACLGLLAMMALLLTSTGLGRQIDQAVFKGLQREQAMVLDDAILLVDLPYPELSIRRDDPVRFRTALAQFLEALAKRERIPPTIVLDFWFAANPAGEAVLADAISLVQARGTRVYASVNLLDRHGALSPEFRDTHNRRLYEDVLDGFGHSLLEHRSGLLSYQAAIRLMTSGKLAADEIVGALPVLAAFGRSQDALIGEQVVFSFSDELPQWQVVTLGNLASERVSAASSLPVDRATHLIVGSFAQDKDNVLKIPGPVLLSYAISEQVRSSGVRPLNSALATIALTGLACALSLLVFVAGFRKIRRTRPPSQWMVRSLAVSVVAFLVSLVAVLACFQFVVASGAVAQTAMPILLAGTLCVSLLLLVRSRQAEAFGAIDLSGNGLESAIEYDVFISYAHEPMANLKWVRTNIYEPLSALKREDGQPFRVFFDEHSIRPGHQWKREIELALLGTRFFVPVYSKNYFERAYCREELEMADQLRIEGRLNIVPIARDADVIPERYLRKVQYLNGNQDGFLERLLEQVQPSRASLTPVRP